MFQRFFPPLSILPADLLSESSLFKPAGRLVSLILFTWLAYADVAEQIDHKVMMFLINQNVFGFPLKYGKREQRDYYYYKIFCILNF